MRILLTGGGTAGHVRPIILIAKSLLKNKRVKFLFVGSRQGIEKKLAKDNDIPFKSIVVGKKRAYFSISNYWDYFKILIGILQSFFVIVFFRPDVIFSKGGYVSFPIVFWLKLIKIPLVIHESDAQIGQANLWAINKASKICLGFPLEYYQGKIPFDKSIYTGIPVNPDFSLTPVKMGERPKILITGGSQGSLKINSLIKEILPELLKKYEIFHITGKKDFSRFQKINNSFYHLYSYTNQMPKIMRDSDLVISRAGASTLAEISASRKAAIIIPLKSAKGEHQEVNADIYRKRNAGVILDEDKLTSNSLLAIINNLINDKNLLDLLSHHAHSLNQEKSVESIVDTIFDSVKSNVKN